MAPVLAAAGLFFAVGVLAILLEVQSPSFVQWNGIKVMADTHAGLTSYHYDGRLISLDNTHDPSTDQGHHPTTVWLSRSDPTDPSKAYIENGYDRWLDFGFVTGWFFVAFGLIAAGFIRQALRRRRRDVRALSSTFGTGISEDIAQRIIEERNQIQQRPPVRVDDD
jgi:hypothetical protein